ncbi:aspartyl-phosphate phosphatase Spo0E family protein [Mesobacillus sp. AQ2]|uniref:aspartyl-phosphate phosphatase Spo0E family protein n=1 Tax=Bacillaceae TaxID=186817 RepID=UPI00203CBE01|nr:MULTISPECIES: aspartyl-phosphate phosphatase Spo0E family protein [Bacillaceae]MCM3123540.1 aspartyl-phosphate phosphatase Spo0E family protein [Mesobacillus sp. MER 33]MCM3232977.1 aspartyl-phosphate phosphatase Spo0E family protein [Mesobacillus sp. MER 48]WHX42052.1 aspartyl-phosphate phosphatase Spo0E family protein [Mesobacillus sp. AQ2]
MYQTQNALLKEIDRVRELMITAALETGYTSNETVRHSQELDTLIYEYQALCKETEVQRQKTKILFRQIILLTKKQYILSHA